MQNDNVKLKSEKQINSFTLVEVIVGIFLMLIVFLGIFGAYQLSLKVIGQSKARVTAIAIGNQKIEQIQNLSYEKVGTYQCKPEYPDCNPDNDEEIIPGYPKGDIKEVAVVVQNGIEYTVTTRIDYVDDPSDGIGEEDNAENCPNGYQNCVNDYKKVNLKIAWTDRFGGEVFFNDIIAPKDCYEECGEKGGILKVSVSHENGELVTFPCIEVENVNSSSPYFGLTKIANPDDGEHYFLLSPDIDAYKVRVSKSGYNSDETYGTGEIYKGRTIANPAKSNASILEGELWPVSFKIDKLSKFLIKTFEAKANHIYYVRKSGLDDNDGLSPDAAFLTIQKAASVMTAGDMVFVGAGDYSEEVAPQNSGTSEDKIIYVADVSGSYTGDAGEVKIFGQNYGFHILNKKYIEIYGFKISDTLNAGIYIEGSGSNDIEIIGNTIFDNPYGIQVESSSGIDIKYNFIYSNSLDGIFLNNSDYSSVMGNVIYQNLLDGIEIASSQNVAVEYNKSFKNGERGIFVYSNSNHFQIKNNIVYLNTLDGIKVFDHASSVNLSGNKSYSNYGSGIVFDGNIVNTNTVISNLVYANQKSGIVLSDNSVNNTVSNNTSFQNSENGILIKLGSNNNEIRDNIITANTLAGIKVSDSSAVNNSYNDVWQNSPDYDGLSADSTEISEDPLFVDPDGEDNILGQEGGEDDSFYLSEVAAGQVQDSLCLDAGSALASDLEMADKTTRTDEVLDLGTVNLGYHYSLEEIPPLPVAPDPFGQAIGDVNFHLLLKTQGGIEAIVGTDSLDEKIYKYSDDNQTNASGSLEMENMEFGSYIFSDFSASGQDLDLITSYPYPANGGKTEVNLSPDSQQEVRLGLRAENTLLITVEDADTSLPLFSAGVNLQKAGCDITKPTDTNGQAYFIPLEKSVYTLEVEMEGYESYSGNISVNGRTEKVIGLNKL